MLKISGQNRFHAPTGDLTAATLKIRELGRRRNVQTFAANSRFFRHFLAFYARFVRCIPLSRSFSQGSVTFQLLRQGERAHPSGYLPVTERSHRAARLHAVKPRR